MPVLVPSPVFIVAPYWCEGDKDGQMQEAY